MPKTRTRIHNLVYKALKALESEPFSTRDLRDAYLKLIPDAEGADPIEVRKYLYKQIMRLQKNGVLEQKRGAHRRDLKFVISEPNMLEHLVKTDGPAPRSTLKAEEEVHTNPQTKSITADLQERLKRCRMDLVASVGETEEYMRLYKHYPELKIDLERQYLASRDRSSELLGKVRAIETVLDGFKEMAS